MNIQEILQEEYRKASANVLDPASLIRMIEEIIEMPTTVSEKVSAPDVDVDTSAALMRLIPDIAVSEIGWSDVRTVEDDEGDTTQVSGPQRRLLEDYLSNISGTTFEERIASLSNFYGSGAGLIQETSNDRIQLITNAVSYLVFYKTLTKIVTNFNASSAGFSFESFLATLVKGEQVPANTGTIADYIDRLTGADIPVSLKLYKGGNMEVGGSFTDLVQDLTDPMYPNSIGGAMRYVICSKYLEGEGLEQEGRIEFHQFDFTLDNVVKILAETKSKNNIRLYRRMMDSMIAGAPEEEIRLPPSEKKASPQELEQDFITNLSSEVADFESPLSQEDFNKLTQALNWAKNDSIFNKGERGQALIGKKRILAWLTKNVDGQLVLPLAAAIIAANMTVVKNNKAKALASARSKVLTGMLTSKEFASPEESVVLYNNPKLTSEQRKVALKNSYGYLSTGHFSMNNSQSVKEGNTAGTIKLGTIMIGTKYVAEALEQVRELLNGEVQEIFESLEMLSNSLNSFFANGLKNDAMAAASIKNANNIRTKEILGGKNSS
jgi:hypothetical protein